MKNFVVALFALAISFSANANPVNPGKQDLKNLRNEITEVLGHPKLQDNTSEDRVTLHFMINAKNEIVVLSTNNSEFDSYIKDKLNYHELEKSNATINKKYTLPLIIRKG